MLLSSVRGESTGWFWKSCEAKVLRIALPHWLMFRDEVQTRLSRCHSVTEVLPSKNILIGLKISIYSIAWNWRKCQNQSCTNQMLNHSHGKSPKLCKLHFCTDPTVIMTDGRFAEFDGEQSNDHSGTDQTERNGKIRWDTGTRALRTDNRNLDSNRTDNMTAVIFDSQCQRLSKHNFSDVPETEIVHQSNWLEFSLSTVYEAKQQVGFYWNPGIAGVHRKVKLFTEISGYGVCPFRLIRVRVLCKGKACRPEAMTETCYARRSSIWKGTNTTEMCPAEKEIILAARNQSLSTIFAPVLCIMAV